MNCQSSRIGRYLYIYGRPHFSLRRKSIFLVNLFIMLLSYGCASVPRWEPSNIELTNKNIHLKGKHVIVSDFFYSDHYVSVTNSQEIETIMESVHVSNISSLIAAELDKAGIHAEAADNLKSSQLKKNEILVRGAIITGNRGCTNTQLIAMLCTLGIVGVFIPSPWGIDGGVNFHYRIEVVDSSQRVLLQTGEKSMSAIYSNSTIWGSMSSMDNKGRLIPVFEDKLVEALETQIFR